MKKQKEDQEKELEVCMCTILIYSFYYSSHIIRLEYNILVIIPVNYYFNF